MIEMPLLIDGHNLIGQMRDLSLSDPNDKDQLIGRLQALADRAKKRMTVVFDPNPLDNTPRIGHGKSQHGALSVIYAPPGRKADDMIRTLVGDTRDRQGLTVITSDAAVADFTHRCGVRVQSSQDFIRWMQAQSSGRPNAEIKPVGSAKEVVNSADVFTEPEPKATAKKPAPPPVKKGKNARIS